MNALADKGSMSYTIKDDWRYDIPHVVQVSLLFLQPIF